MTDPRIDWLMKFAISPGPGVFEDSAKEREFARSIIDDLESIAAVRDKALEDAAQLVDARGKHPILASAIRKLAREP